VTDLDQGALWQWQHARDAVPPLSLEAIDFAEIPGWQDDDHCTALECYLLSAPLAAQPAPMPPDNNLRSLLHDREQARNFFEENFRAHRVLAEPGLLTSYFEPTLKGSRARSAEFPVPVLRRPNDLKPLPEGHDLRAHGLTAARDVSGKFEPYATRGEIEAGALKGEDLELLYLADSIEAFVMHVQGSGMVKLDDYTIVRLSFDGKNGHPYTSISRRLVERGCLAVEDAHLDGTITWLRTHPDPQALLNENKSYIFFKELEISETGPKGSLGAPLRASRSLAVDPLYHTLGMPIWAAAPELTYDGEPLRRLLIAQDTGSAIIGPQRGDIFAGMGTEAGRIAGRIRHRCEFIVLRPRQRLESAAGDSHGRPPPEEAPLG
jgi:membrane-bound lytic murein transglycosylase A